MEIKLYIEIATISAIILWFIIRLFWEIKKSGLKEVAIKYIVRAEDIYNKGDNQEKLNFVIDKVIAFIPMPFRLFITREAIKELVQSVFDSVKSALDFVPKKGE